MLQGINLMKQKYELLFLFYCKPHLTNIKIRVPALTSQRPNKRIENAKQLRIEMKTVTSSMAVLFFFWWSMYLINDNKSCKLIVMHSFLDSYPLLQKKNECVI